MSRPLELTIHPRTAGWDSQSEDWYTWQGTEVRPLTADMYAVNKHLSEPELASEYWQAAEKATYARGRVDRCLDNPLPYTADKAEEILGILARFATHPHYDEAA